MNRNTGNWDACCVHRFDSVDTCMSVTGSHPMENNPTL